MLQLADSNRIMKETNRSRFRTIKVDRCFHQLEMGEEDFAVKDVASLRLAPSSKSVRYVFENSGYRVQRFIKMPGRAFYCLQIRRTSAPPCATKRQARRHVAEILDLVGLKPGRDDLLVDGMGDGLMIGLGVALEDVNASAGFLEL